MAIHFINSFFKGDLMRILLNKGGLLIVEVDGIMWILAGYLRINLPWLIRHHPEIVKIFPLIK